jgi:hypothetical protein
MGAVHSGIAAGGARAKGATSRRSRDDVLGEAALDAARIWVRQWVEDLERDGRPVEGGWPGTLNEARGRCAEVSARTLARLAMLAPARDEVERFTHITYAEARRLWRAT